MLKLLIEPDGEITAIYSDVLAPLISEGRAEISRASNVEPDPRGGWTATMRDGALIGPFNLRQTALDAEVDYLETQLGF